MAAQMAAQMAALEAGIVSADAEALAAFYRAGLGFEDVVTLTFPQGVVCRLRRGHAGLKLFTPSHDTIGRPPLDTWSSERGWAYAALHVDDADREVAAAEAAGAAVLHPVTAHRPGARFALIADPEGNVWEILEESAAPSAV